MGFWDFLFRKKKEEKVSLPHTYGIIDYTESAKKDGLFIEENKEIRIFEGRTPNEEPSMVYPYTKRIANAIQEIRGIPLKDISKVEMDEVIEEINPALLESETIG